MSKNNATSCTVVNYKCDYFEKLSSDELELIRKNELTVKYKKGETICKQGTFASHIMVVEKGLAKVCIEGDTDSLILKIIPKGNILGLTSIPENNNESSIKRHDFAK